MIRTMRMLKTKITTSAQPVPGIKLIRTLLLLLSAMLLEKNSICIQVAAESVPIFNLSPHFSQKRLTRSLRRCPLLLSLHYRTFSWRAWLIPGWASVAHFAASIPPLMPSPPIPTLFFASWQSVCHVSQYIIIIIIIIIIVIVIFTIGIIFAVFSWHLVNR
jgi:hypothetical protein